jgi:lipopolysaccharide transport system ATP-binding protein
MPADTVISVQNLSKRYLVGHEGPQERYRSLRDTVVRHGKNFLRKTVDMARGKQIIQGDSVEEFWALQDVSFEVKRGEVLGIIGRNGAGKSTLLKILSRITEPTSGRITLQGSVASLLEVGTGFHPELTGRENIFLNGAILGMQRTEIKAKFDEIVSFAEVENFLDTPVKRYSSGMYVRLAFAVAAHLEPEILVVDEVLAVGDAQFQKKCLGKMQDVASRGRTVLFVSHNMAAIQGLCSRSLVLSRGCLVIDTDTRAAIQQSSKLDRVISTSLNGAHYRNRGSRVTIEAVRLLVNGDESKTVHSGDFCSFEISYRCLHPETLGKKLSVSLMFYISGIKIVNLWTNYSDSTILIEQKGVVSCKISRWPLREAEIHVEIYSHVGEEVQDWIEDCLIFESADGDFYGSGVITHSGQGVVFFEHEWNKVSNEIICGGVADKKVN